MADQNGPKVEEFDTEGEHVTLVDYREGQVRSRKFTDVNVGQGAVIRPNEDPTTESVPVLVGMFTTAHLDGSDEQQVIGFLSSEQVLQLIADCLMTLFECDRTKVEAVAQTIQDQLDG